MVLDGLRRGEKTGIQRGRAFVFLHDLGAFVGDADNGVAFLGLRLLVDRGEDLF